MLAAPMSEGNEKSKKVRAAHHGLPFTKKLGLQCGCGPHRKNTFTNELLASY
jgi:hypothetical protein